MTTSNQRILPRLAAVELLAVAAACSGGGSSSGGSLVVSSIHAVDAAAAQVELSERWIAFQADEGTTGVLPGTDMNADGDRSDQIAVVIDMADGLQTPLGVAVLSLHWAATSELYLVVSEADDGQNWESPSDLGTNTVLLHWSAASATLTYVDTLADPRIAVTGDLVFFASSTAAPAAATESSVRVIDASSAPLIFFDVPTDDATAKLEPVILGEDQGLVFLALDEVIEARDLNADADLTDGFVLALLDGTSVASTILGTELALQDAAAPFRGLALAAGDWLVGFLVSEATQGAASLNDFNDFVAAWLPTQCSSTPDTDTTDQVLHFLRFAAWSADSVASPPRNTGIAGTSRVLAVANNVGTISPEADDGCDLNDDGDTTDNVFRWAAAVAPPAPVVPVGDEALLRALFDLPGGTLGAAELENRWVIVVDEMADSEDINGGGLADHLIGWINPAALGAGFTFDHEPGAATAFGAATWMAEQSGRNLLPMAFEESFTGTTNGDGDQDDSYPSWTDFNSGFSELLFSGVTRAVDQDNAGLIVTKGIAFYRIDEAADERDWNGDGDMTDFVVSRTHLTSFFTAFVSETTAHPRIVMTVDQRMTPFGGAFLADEASAGRDFNDDGDMTDEVLRWLRF